MMCGHKKGRLFGRKMRDEGVRQHGPDFAPIMVDEEMLDLVESLSNIQCHVVDCCQGDPGPTYIKVDAVALLEYQILGVRKDDELMNRCMVTSKFERDGDTPIWNLMLRIEFPREDLPKMTAYAREAGGYSVTHAGGID